jgi:K+-transporting ATPase ATPase B chain
MLITRGALTTFSIANDVAKYFAIIPAAFAATYPQLNALNVMGLGSPSSAILSAVIFNALIIVALIPLALRGIATHADTAAALLRRNLLIYGLGGLVVPFIGIKAIDLLLVGLGLGLGSFMKRDISTAAILFVLLTIVTGSYPGSLPAWRSCHTRANGT